MTFDPIDTLKHEWPVISGAPWSITVIVCLVGGIVWIVFRTIHKQELATTKARAELAEERVKGHERVIRDQRPTKTAFSDLENQVLHERTMALAVKLCQYQADEQLREKQLREYDSTVGATWGNAEDYVARSLAKTSERQEMRNAYFQANFKIDAVLLRNEIISRLPPGQPPNGIWGPGGEYRIDLSHYDKLIYIWQLEKLANHLQGLAKLLPNVSTPQDPPTSTPSRPQ